MNSSIMKKVLCLTIAIVQLYCGSLFSQRFYQQVQVGTLQDRQLNEVSGIAASSIKRNCFWVHNDSGDSARLFLVAASGQLKGTVLFNEKVGDCEDIAMGIGMNKGKYVYLADIGDNIEWRAKVFLYIFKEKDLINALSSKHIDTYKKTELEYEDGMFNAETLMVDNTDSLLYVVTKDRQATFLYFAKIKDVFNRNKVVLNRIAQLPCTNITAGDISPSGKQILLKNYDSVFYWKRSSNEHIYETLKRPAILIPYSREHQGEAICFAADDRGFYATSEGSFSPIYFFRKKQ